VAGAGYLAGAAPYMGLLLGSANVTLSEANPHKAAKRKQACRILKQLPMSLTISQLIIGLNWFYLCHGER
jgi:hypothetical protein